MKSKKISILSLNASNWQSVRAALKSCGYDSTACKPSDLRKIDENSILIIPGVGHINSLHKEIDSTIGITDLNILIKKRNITVIGICLGFQFMCTNIEENISLNCLGLFPDQVKCINQHEIPSVGWQKLQHDDCKSCSKKFAQSIEILKSNSFYFTHSYGVIEGDHRPSDIVFSYTNETNKKIRGLYIRDNYIGFQFHPGHGLRVITF